MDFRASPSRFNDVNFFTKLVGNSVNDIKDSIHDVKQALKELSNKYNVKNANITSLISSIEAIINKYKFGKSDVHLLFPYINNLKQINEDLLLYNRRQSNRDNELIISSIYFFIMRRLGSIELRLEEIKMAYKYIGRYKSSSK